MAQTKRPYSTVTDRIATNLAPEPHTLSDETWQAYALYCDRNSNFEFVLPDVEDGFRIFLFNHPDNGSHSGFVEINTMGSTTIEEGDISLPIALGFDFNIELYYNADRDTWRGISSNF